MGITRCMKIYQIADGYCYNSDSLFLWNFSLPYIKKHAKVLEIGSGSGIIGMLCARDKDIILCQIEKQKEYALLNIKNAQINNIDTNVFCVDCKELFISKNVIEQLKNITKNNTNNSNIQNNSMQYFDVIISNPPFYAKRTLPSLNTFKEQATQGYNLPLEVILQTAHKLLKPNARLIFCYTPYMFSDTFYLLKNFNFSIETIRFVHPRVNKNATLVLICAKKSNDTQTLILPPLITHDGKRQQDNTQEVKDIYNNAKTHSIKILIKDILWNEFNIKNI